MLSQDIHWFCYIAVANEVFTQEQATALADICSAETSLVEFAQATLANQFTDNQEIVQQLINMAFQKAQEGPCTESFLPQAAPAPVAPAPAPVQETTPAPSTNSAGETVRPRAIKLRSSTLTPEEKAQAQQDDEPIKQMSAKEAMLADTSYEKHEVIAEDIPKTVSAPQESRPAEEARPSAAPASSGTFDFSAFPDLSKAETASPEDCKQLMVDFLRVARRFNCSDIHVSAKACPYVRQFKVIKLFDHIDPLSPEAAKKLNYALLDAKQVTAFEENLELDYSCELDKGDRYRSNLMIHNDGMEGSYRVISEKIQSLKELGFIDTATIEKLTTYHQGLVLVTGPASAGKTTTLASLVQLINKARQDHMITVEDPVEIIVPSMNCNVTQRQLGSSTLSFANALKAALREDPDIIILGEMRDLETIEMALSAAETGHLVIGTLNTKSAMATLDRILDVFPPSQQPQIRAMLAESIKGVICQDLLPSADGTRAVMVPEILIGNLAVSNIIKESKTASLASVLETGQKSGMILKEDSVLNRYMEGAISYETALANLNNKPRIEKLKSILAAGGPEAYLARQQAGGSSATSAPAGGETKKKGWFKK